jgi:hypothetical protein
VPELTKRRSWLEVTPQDAAIPAERSRLRSFVTLVAGVVLSALIGFLVLSQRDVIALDYRAFYCAGMALRLHANPYHTAVLHTCEVQATDKRYVERLHGVTLPAPQPAYDLAMFAVLSTLPFALSKALWGAALGIAFFVTVTSLIRLTSLSPPLIFAIVATSLIGASLALGQIIPIYAAAACTAALMAKQGKWGWAGVAAAVSLVEPHLGLPMCLALAFWAPRARFTLLLTSGALVGIALLTAGPAVNLEYLTTVLPLHALSELGSDGQLSLSVIFHGLHASDAVAIGAGTFSYCLMSILGIWLARVASARFQNAGFLVAVPAAASVVGGSFLHATDIVAALPLVLLLIAVSQYRLLFLTAVVLLATPWLAQSPVNEMIPWFLLSAVCAGYAIWALGARSVYASVACAAAIFIALLEGNSAYSRAQQVYLSQSHVTRTVIDEKYPQASWARINTSALSTQSLPSWLMRLPTWSGLALLIAGTGLAIRYRTGTTHSNALRESS